MLRDFTARFTGQSELPEIIFPFATHGMTSNVHIASFEGFATLRKYPDMSTKILRNK